MSFVLDCSVTLTWFFEDEQTPATQQLLLEVETGGALVPPLWRLEIANGLQTALRRGRIDVLRRDRYLLSLNGLSLELDEDSQGVGLDALIALSDLHRLTIYDATYLELALRIGLPLATLDRALRRAAQACDVTVLPPMA